MRKMKKFSEGGKTSRAQGKMDRRMADIEKDFQRALAKGKSEKEARAKRAQREADARDDFAKRTGADRTQTRAAEKAAEARLTAARRSPDKDMKPVSAASTPSAMTKIDMPKVETPKVGASSGKQTFSQAFAEARKGGAKTFTWNGKSYTTEMRGEKKPATPARTTGKGPAPAATATGKPPATPATSRLLSGAMPDARKLAETELANKRKAEQISSAQRAAIARGQRPAKFKDPVSTAFAKGGKISEGKRNMAKLPSKNYLAERLRKAAEGPENRSAESLQRGAVERGNREQARETQDRKAKRPMAKGGKVMKHASKAGNAMKKKSADTMGRAMVKKYAKGGSIDGCATKGKTKTKMVKMAMGGMTGYKRGGKTC